MRELRIKLDIVVEGLGPAKLNRVINFGLDLDSNSGSGAKIDTNLRKRQ